MSNLVYLTNGQAAYLREEIGNKYIVTKIMEVEDDEGIPFDVESDPIVVDKIFTNPPVAKIHSDIKVAEETRDNLLKQVGEAVEEIRQKERKLKELSTTLISKEKFILDRSDLINAKSLAIFTDELFMPMLLDSENFGYRGFERLKLSITIEIKSGSESSWAYSISSDEDRWSGSHKISQQYGILVNPTKEEVDEMIKKRLSEFDTSKHNAGWMLRNVPEHLLSEELKDFVKNEKVKDLNKSISNLEFDIESKYSRINLLKKEISEIR